MRACVRVPSPAGCHGPKCGGANPCGGNLCGMLEPRSRAVVVFAEQTTGNWRGTAAGPAGGHLFVASTPAFRRAAARCLERAFRSERGLSGSYASNFTRDALPGTHTHTHRHTYTHSHTHISAATRVHSSRGAARPASGLSVIVFVVGVGRGVRRKKRNRRSSP